MQMLSHWIQDPSSDARIRVLEGSDASQTNGQVARITHTNAFVRVRPDTGDYPDALNWVRMGPGMAALSWCASMLKNMGYALPEEGSFVIRYDDGAFNHGPHGTDKAPQVRLNPPTFFHEVQQCPGMPSNKSASKQFRPIQ